MQSTSNMLIVIPKPNKPPLSSTCAVTVGVAGETGAVATVVLSFLVLSVVATGVVRSFGAGFVGRVVSCANTVFGESHEKHSNKMLKRRFNFIIKVEICYVKNRPRWSGYVKNRPRWSGYVKNLLVLECAINCRSVHLGACLRSQRYD